MHKVAKKPAGKGDPFANAGRRSARSKRGINAPPSKQEKKLPPTKRHTKAGGMSERLSTMEPGGVRWKVLVFSPLSIHSLSLPSSIFSALLQYLS